MFHESQLTGGSLSTGGRLTSGVRATGSQRRSAPTKRGRQTYHDLIHMPQHKWEQVREAASQMLGNRESPMWGKMHVRTPEFGGKRTLTDISRLSTPQDAARAVELEGVDGADFTSGVRHVVDQVKRLQ